MIIPQFNIGEALLYSSSISIFFVASLYLFLDTQQRKYSRNLPFIIKRRFASVTLTCVLATVWLAIWWHWRGGENWRIVFSQLMVELGLKPKNGWISFIKAMSLINVLFLGSTFQLFIQEELPFQRNYVWAQAKSDILSLIGIRAYLVGPLSEEYVFRACFLAMFKRTDISSKALIFGLPMFFGAAHLHHLFESWRAGISLKKAIFISLFQFGYTTLFGWFATFLFLRTGSFYNIFFAHVFCNALGLPFLPENDNPSWLRNMAILLYVFGLVGFCILIYPLTEV